MMKLQVALDMLTTEEALSVMQKIEACVDIIEIGTPLIKHEGLGVLKKLRWQYPRHEILVDLKTMDVGEYEADFCFGEGADIVTVLGHADNDTISGAIGSARRHDKKVLVDLINIPDKPARARQVKELGADYIGIHSGIDQQLRGISPLQDLIEVSTEIDSGIAVAGGINLDTIDAIIQQQPDVVIVGGAITGAEMPEKTAGEMQYRVGLGSTAGEARYVANGIG